MLPAAFAWAFDPTCAGRSLDPRAIHPKRTSAQAPGRSLNTFFERSHHAHVRQPTPSDRVETFLHSIRRLAMKRSAIIFATVGALALAGIASTGPAEARRGFGPGLAGGLIAGALIAGAASSAYAYAPGYYGPAYGYGGGGYGPGYYGGSVPYGYSYGGYGGYDQSQHGGQPYYGR